MHGFNVRTTAAHLIRPDRCVRNGKRSQNPFGNLRMSDVASENATHGDGDHGFGDVEPLFIVAHEPPPLVIQPKVRSTAAAHSAIW